MMSARIFSFRWGIATLTAILALGGLRAESVPRVEVSKIRRVFHNGEHNAFTDLIRFQGRFYLTFRSCPEGHGVHDSASIIVLSSADAESWEQVYRFSVEKRDTRDPHFLIFRDQLFIYSGTWYDDPSGQFDLNQHLGYGVYTSDGLNWAPPTILQGTFGHYVWKAAAFGGNAYLCGRRKTNYAVGPKGEGKAVRSVMLESSDGLIWRQRAFFQTEAGDETVFCFEEDGSIIAIGRRGSDTAQLCRARAPYQEWQRSDLDHYIGGPLLSRWGNRWVVGGRKFTQSRGPKTSFYWLKNGNLEEFAELPSAGDNSYPGFVELSSTRALISWYSSHEKDDRGNPMTAIYLAELRLP
tara:strand:+ start:280 stop:1338 length:1059 start_codon:yes stop_codon:yes gene_type:complete